MRTIYENIASAMDFRGAVLRHEWSTPFNVESYIFFYNYWRSEAEEQLILIYLDKERLKRTLDFIFRIKEEEEK